MQINLPQPCNENWQKMPLDEKGRHCQKCDKVVHDFTSYSDAELVRFFREDTKVCGRFNTAQTGRDLDHKSASTSKWAVAACSMLMVLSSELQAQNDIQVSRDSGIQTQILNPAQINRIVRIRFEKALSFETSISRMRMTMPGFSIDTLVDSTNMLSISIPSQYNNYIAEIDLYNHLGDSFHFTSVTFGLGEIGFTNASGVWAIKPIELFPIDFNRIIHPQIVMGIPAPITIINYPVTQILEPSWDSLKVYTISDSLLNTKKDSGVVKQEREVIPVKDKIKDTQKGMSTGMLIGWIAAVLGLLVLTFRKWLRKAKA